MPPAAALVPCAGGVEVVVCSVDALLGVPAKFKKREDILVVR